MAIIKERTAKYLAIHVDYKKRTSERISVMDIPNLNAITAINKVVIGFGITDTLEMLDNDDSTITFRVMDEGETVGVVYVIDARYLGRYVLVSTPPRNTQNGDLIVANGESYQELRHMAKQVNYEDGSASIIIENQNPNFYVRGV